MKEKLPSKKIMLVEDDPDLAEVIMLRFRDAGFEVIHCADGESAIQEIKVNEPDLLILDVFLPAVDGYSALKAIKDYLRRTKGRDDVPVIVITGRGALMKDMFKLEGVRDFIQKPFEAAELLEIVKQHVA